MARHGSAGPLITAGLLSALLVGAAPLHAQLERYEFTETHMGMAVRLALYAPRPDAARQAARTAFDRVAALEDILSDWRPESEVRRLTSAVGRPVRVSRDLWIVLSRALTLAAQTGGAFDPTVGPYTELWRLARRTGRLPSDSALRAAGSRVGWRMLSLDSLARTVTVTRPGMRLDLGAIAKGYILDEALFALRRAGISRALIEAGGDIVVGDAPPGAGGWRVDVGRAAAGLASRASALVNSAVATSGDEAQHLDVGGVRYSHVVDPRTGRALTGRVRVTLIASDGMTADGLATALSVLDVAARRALLAQYPGTGAAVSDAGKRAARR